MTDIVLHQETETAKMTSLENIVDEILGDAFVQVQHNSKAFKGDAINWGDLGCESVEIVISQTFEKTYRVTITEAAPSSNLLIFFIYDELRKRSHKNVDVVTEW